MSELRGALVLLVAFTFFLDHPGLGRLRNVHEAKSVVRAPKSRRLKCMNTPGQGGRTVCSAFKGGVDEKHHPHDGQSENDCDCGA